MIDFENFSDEALPGILDHYDNWQPPSEFAPAVPAGIYQLYLAQVREAAEFDTDDGKRLSTTVDLRVLGGEHDERAVMWQRMSNSMYERPRGSGNKTSQLMDLMKAASISPLPVSNKQFVQALLSLAQSGASSPFQAQLDWRGFCTTCYAKKAMATTGKSNAKDAQRELSGEQRNDAADYATKAKDYRGFPVDANGDRVDNFLCPDCGDEVRAQVRIRRFVLPVEDGNAA